MMYTIPDRVAGWGMAGSIRGHRPAPCSACPHPCILLVWVNRGVVQYYRTLLVGEYWSTGVPGTTSTIVRFTDQYTTCTIYQLIICTKYEIYFKIERVYILYMAVFTSENQTDSICHTHVIRYFQNIETDIYVTFR